jgi:hypothetical protein
MFEATQDIVSIILGCCFIISELLPFLQKYVTGNGILHFLLIATKIITIYEETLPTTNPISTVVPSVPQTTTKSLIINSYQHSSPENTISVYV